MGKLEQDFTKLEQDIINMFQVGSSFNYNGDKYEVVLSGKPRPAKGECKTDVYIKARNKSNGKEKEWKISVKKSNADFLENKIGIERAREIFGDEAQRIIKKSIEAIKEKFEDTPLVYYEKCNKTDALSITLGWKFELTNKSSGEKSAELKLKDNQKIDVYAGSNLSENKRNSVVNNKTIKDSGVANCILEVEDMSTLNAEIVIECLKDIKEFAKQQRIYFACKALNYRLKKDKWDGDRPLSVYVNWTKKDDKLHGSLIFDSPLSKKGNEIGEKVRQLLKTLNITKPISAVGLKSVIHKDVPIHT